MALKPERVPQLVFKDKVETEIIDEALQGDWFMKTGFQKYGEDWPAYVPDSINVFMDYYFQMQLLVNQLRAYYCPISDIMIQGGRYSAKTAGLACGSAAYIALHPGINQLHVSPSLDQATVSFTEIQQRGSTGKFWETFIYHSREHPAPTIYFKRWDQYDPGSTIQYRSIGQNPMELLRSLQAGYLTGDEAFRTQYTDAPYRVMAGMARGPNMYILNKHPELRKEYDALAFGVSHAANWTERDKLQKVMDKFAEKHGIAREFRLMLYGNAGAYSWEWDRFNWGLQHPDKRYCATWTTYDNPYCTQAQRDLLIQQYQDDPGGLEHEMMATRPAAAGDVFKAGHTTSLFHGDLDEMALKAVDDGKPGWIWDYHESYGLLRYAKPQEGGAYAVGADPGTGRVPNRNKWVNMVFRIDKRPYELYYMATGSVGAKGQGSIDEWILDSRYIMAHYPMAEENFAAEASGTQRDVHQVVWPDDLRVIPLSLQTIKPTLIMQLQLMLSRDLFIAPNIALLEREMLGYKIQDKRLSQDFVMAFLAASSVIWPYVADEFNLEEKALERRDAWQAIEARAGGGREVRDEDRDFRER